MSPDWLPQHNFDCNTCSSHCAWILWIDWMIVLYFRWIIMLKNKTLTGWVLQEVKMLSATAQGYTGNEFSNLGSFFFSLIRATYQLHNQAHYYKRKFHMIWYVSFYQIRLSSTSDNIHSAVIDGISPLYPVIQCKRCYSSSLTAYFLPLIAYLLKHWKPTKACPTTTMQSIWCNFVTQSLFDTLNYWKSQLGAILDLNFWRLNFFFLAWWLDLPTNIGCQIINPVYPCHSCGR